MKTSDMIGRTVFDEREYAYWLATAPQARHYRAKFGITKLNFTRKPYRKRVKEVDPVARKAMHVKYAGDDKLIFEQRFLSNLKEPTEREKLRFSALTEYLMNMKQ